MSAPQFVSFDKDTDGVEVGLLSVTNGRTTEWYSQSVADRCHGYFDELRAPLGWELDVLIVLGHGRAGGNSLGTDDHRKVNIDELAAFLHRNIRAKKVLVNACHAGDSGGTPGNSFAQKLSARLKTTTYGPVESLQRHDSRGKFYTDRRYHWMQFDDGTDAATDLGEHTLRELVRHILHAHALHGPPAPRRTASPPRGSGGSPPPELPKVADRIPRPAATEGKTSSTKVTGNKEKIGSGAASRGSAAEVESASGLDLRLETCALPAASSRRTKICDKDTDGVEVGLLSVTNGRTTEWYSQSVADRCHGYFDELRAPLGWDLDVLIVLGHGRAGGNIIGDEDSDVVVEDLIAFIEGNIRARALLLLVAQSGDSGAKRGNSLGNALSKSLRVPTYAPVEILDQFDNKLKFFHTVKYNWNKYVNNTKVKMGALTVEDILVHIWGQAGNMAHRSIEGTADAEQNDATIRNCVVNCNKKKSSSTKRSK